LFEWWIWIHGLSREVHGAKTTCGARNPGLCSREFIYGAIYVRAHNNNTVRGVGTATGVCRCERQVMELLDLGGSDMPLALRTTGDDHPHCNDASIATRASN